jgi:hypothetical protein
MRNILTVALVYLCISADSVNALSQKSNPSRIDRSRKAFFRQIPIGIGALLQVATLDTSKSTPGSHIGHNHDCSCPSCSVLASRSIGDRINFSKVAFAYERRDVGGDAPSSDMAAMNLQAFETMNRLEKDGVKLEVRFRFKM